MNLAAFLRNRVCASAPLAARFFLALVIGLAATTAFAAGSGAPSLRTSKMVYEENEPVSVEFEGVSAGKYRIVVAPLGARDTVAFQRSPTIRGKTSGTETLKGKTLAAGSYEARIRDDKGGAILARARFTVGNNCLDRGAETPEFCPLAVRVSQAEYAPGEAIAVAFEGAPAHGKQWIALVPIGSQTRFPAGKYKKAPDGQEKPWTVVRGQTGKHVFSGVGAGEYEVQFIHEQEGPAPVARAPVIVNAAEPPPEMVAQIPAATQSEDALEQALSQAEQQEALLERSQPATAASKDAGDGPERHMPTPGVDGSWLVRISCAPGGTNVSNALLDVTRDGESALTGKLFLLFPDPSRVAVYVNGSYDPKSGALSLDAGQWMYRPSDKVADQEPLKITATLEGSGLSLSGAIENWPGCRELSATKFKRDERPDYEEGLLPRWRKQKSAMIDTKTCVAFFKWSVDAGVVSVAGEKLPAQVVDRDSFYRTIGKPYDQWNQEDRDAYAALLKSCVTRLRKSDYDKAARAAIKEERTVRKLESFLADVPGSTYKASDWRSHLAYLDKYAHVVSLRNARDYAERDVREAQALPPSLASRERIAAMLASYNLASGPLWVLPSDEAESYKTSLRDQDANIARQLSKQALAQSEVPLARIMDMPDGADRLAAVKELLAPLLPVDQRPVAETLLGSSLTAIEALPVQDETLADINAQAMKIEPTSALLSNDIQDEYRKRIDQKRSDVFSALVNGRIAQLDTLTPNKDGLARSTTWAKAFSASFQDFSGSPVYVSAMKHFRTVRAKVLLGSFPAFETELGAASEQGNRDDILSQYLSWEGDQSLPVSLMYQISYQLRRR